MGLKQIKIITLIIALAVISAIGYFSFRFFIAKEIDIAEINAPEFDYSLGDLDLGGLNLESFDFDFSLPKEFFSNIEMSANLSGYVNFSINPPLVEFNVFEPEE